LALSLIFSGFKFLPEAEPKAEAGLFDREPVTVTVYYMPTCKACHKVMDDIIPPIALKYGSRVRWEYLNTEDRNNYAQFLALQSFTLKNIGTPAIVIGKRILIGVSDAQEYLEKVLEEELKNEVEAEPAFEGKTVDIMERFRSFGPWAVIGAGLADGFNPCAFTVVIFFVSFLTLMGYRRHETAIIGAFYILAVFLTYLLLGLGFFKALYMMKSFRLFSKIMYISIGSLSIFLGLLALKDYIIFKRSGKTDGMSLQLPLPVKNRIRGIVSDFYRKDKTGKGKALAGLALSALIVGFLVSLLEAVCTGQLYLPTIVFVLKEGTLRARALFFLILYNVMFIFPLVIILLA
ncbi:MAG TPA: hypothetical protein PLU24_06555, partial [Candidatus Omnitrophota bacterium]|nr:hypothetical protein [Candidatus Omnitrophota bacterium]